MAGTVLRPVSTPRPTGASDWGSVPRLLFRGERPTVGPLGGTLGDRSSRLARLSAASATCKLPRSSPLSGNHPSIWASSGHRFLRCCGGAWPIRGDSTAIGWDQGIDGCSPPTSSRLRHSRGSSLRASGSVRLPVRRYLAASLEASAARHHSGFSVWAEQVVQPDQPACPACPEPVEGSLSKGPGRAPRTLPRPGPRSPRLPLLDPRRPRPHPHPACREPPPRR